VRAQNWARLFSPFTVRFDLICCTATFKALASMLLAPMSSNPPPLLLLFRHALSVESWAFHTIYFPAFFMAAALTRAAVAKFICAKLNVQLPPDL
jgi:hypothetical protein